MRKHLMQRTWGLLCLLCLLLSGCGQQQEVNKDVKIETETSYVSPYELEAVEKGDIQKAITIGCMYTMMDSQDYKFVLDKKLVKRVYVEAGDLVKKGDILAILDAEDTDAKLADMQHTIDKLKLKLEFLTENRNFDISTCDITYSYSRMTEDDRTDRDDQKKNIDKAYASDVEDLQDQIYISEMRLKEYQDYYSQSRLVAEMDGVVYFVKKGLEGSVTVADEKVITLYNNDACIFTSSNIEAIEYIKDDMEYEVTVGNGKNQKTCTVRPVRRDEWDKKIFFELTDGTADIAVSTQGKISILIDEAKNVLNISAEALHQSKDKYFVYVVDEEGIRKMQYVEVGLIGEERVEIRSGLTEGQYIIKQ